MTSELTDREKNISKITIWIWRNLLASGVFLVCFGFLYSKCENIEDNLIEVRTVLQERIQLERGDYGWSAPSHEERKITKETIEKGIDVRQHIDSFANEKFE